MPDIEVCGFFEGHSAAGNDAVLPPGVYTLHDLRQFGRKKGWCPYYLARHMVSYANVVVWSYQYMIDPKVSQMVRLSRARRFSHLCRHLPRPRLAPACAFLLVDPAVCPPRLPQGQEGGRAI